MGRVRDTDRGWNQIQRELKRFGAGRVFVGIQGAKATEQNGPATVVEIGTFHEFGTATTPERSFLRSTLDDNKREIVERILTEAGAVTDRKRKADVALARVGAFVVELVRRKIRSRISPPLSDATVARKGSDMPLIDTGRLIQSLTYKVEINGTEVAAG